MATLARAYTSSAYYRQFTCICGSNSNCQLYFRAGRLAIASNPSASRPPAVRWRRRGLPRNLVSHPNLCRQLELGAGPKGGSRCRISKSRSSNDRIIFQPHVFRIFAQHSTSLGLGYINSGICRKRYQTRIPVSESDKGTKDTAQGAEHC